MGWIIPVVQAGAAIYGATQAGKGGGGDNNAVESGVKAEPKKKNLLFSPKKATKSKTGSLISGVQ